MFFEKVIYKKTNTAALAYKPPATKNKIPLPKKSRMSIATTLPITDVQPLTAQPSERARELMERLRIASGNGIPITIPPGTIIAAKHSNLG